MWQYWVLWTWLGCLYFNAFKYSWTHHLGNPQALHSSTPVWQIVTQFLSSHPFEPCEQNLQPDVRWSAFTQCQLKSVSKVFYVLQIQLIRIFESGSLWYVPEVMYTCLKNWNRFQLCMLPFSERNSHSPHCRQISLQSPPSGFSEKCASHFESLSLVLQYIW